MAVTKSIGKWRILCKGENILATYVSRSREVLSRFMSTMPKIHGGTTELQFQYKGADRWNVYDPATMTLPAGTAGKKTAAGGARGQTGSGGKKPIGSKRKQPVGSR